MPAIAKRSISHRVVDTAPSATVLIADIASQLRRQGARVIDFSAGRAVEHTPKYICEVGSRAILEGDTHQTMAQGKPEYREACVRKLARDNGITADPDANIIATMGCKEGLLLALLATVDQGDEVIVEDPCFVSYQPEIRFAGGVPIPVPLRSANRFRWSAADLESAITTRTRAILICSPQNPTGAVHTPDELEVVARVAKKHDLYVITDETYERLAWNGHEHTCIATLPDMQERTIGLMGVTKAFSMGGWRIGFNYAPEPVTQGMVVLQQHLVTCASSFAQRGAAQAIGDPPPNDVQEMWGDWERRCAFAVEALNGIPELSCEMPEGGFYAWIDVRATHIPDRDLAERLLRDHHVALVPGSAFGPHGDGYLRMTCVKSWDDLREGLSRIRDAVGGR